ncbi:DNA-binding CsgD family transcriptional regulator [Nocardiopsis mwathae]|uniref:DNA-binding CsgD family transcriptional regulator n=1 Tax=Nocardiopsis mwathae TaxID=1472723 RepID=A0A7W9YHV5_9ACTN|nr:DNA-binding CsgD family transcriptional regulator [Nocardiopsis mwathae]
MCSPPLVGRDRERGLLARATAQQRAVVLISGEAGTGKTRLVHELGVPPDAPARAGPLLGRCHPAPAPFPYGPLIEALRGAPIPARLNPVCGTLHPLLPECAHLLPDPPPAPADHSSRRHRLFRAFREILTALAPAVLVIEDVHWIDPDTRALLDFLVPRPPDRLTLVLTYRPEELPGDYPVAALAARLPPGTFRAELELDPLTPDDIGHLCDAMLGDHRPLPGGFAARLHTRTRGNPLAAVELLRHLRATGTDPARPTGPDDTGLPPALRDALLERLSRLGRHARAIVHTAAVLGEPATEALLTAVAELTPVHAARGLDQALTRRILHTAPDGAIGFPHPLMLQAAYNSLPLARRRRLHRRAAAVLGTEPDPPYAAMAAHSREAGLHDAWTTYAEQAADRAVATGDDGTAAELLRDALTRPRLTPAARSRLAVKLGRAALTGLATEETITLLRQIIDEQGLSAGIRGELRLELGLLLLNQAGQGAQARNELARACAELSHRPALAARAMSALAVPRSTPEPVDAHRRWLRRATAAAGHSGDPVISTAVAVNRATLLAQLGDARAWEVALPDPADPLERAQRREFTRGALNLADAAVMLGDYPRAEHYLRLTTELATTAEVPFTLVLVGAESTGLLLDWARGRWEGLAERARGAARSPHLAGLPLVAAEIDLVRANLALAQGDPAEAEELLRGVGGAAAAHLVPIRAAALGTLGRILLARGEAEGAWRGIDPVLCLIRSKGIWVWASDLTPGLEALLALGHDTLADDLLTRFAAGVEGAAAPAAAAALPRWRALVAEHRGQAAEAAALFAQAEAAYRALPRPYDAARMLEARGRCLPGEGETAVLAEALRAYLVLGASWDAARCRRALRERGVSTPHVGQRGYGGALSPREQEIVRLAAGGRTNREIAAMLYLSPRTVETHVANALGKLGLRSRKELARGR